MLSYRENYDGIMMTGNAVVRRAFVDGVGGFNPTLGRVGPRLTAGEDADYHQRLLAAGARGYNIPRLIIYHHIPPERLTKRYHRRWCFYRGVSLAQIDNTRLEPVARAFGVPRYLFGNLGRAVLDMARAICSRKRDPERLFSSELAVWDLAAFLCGKHLVRPAAAAPPNRLCRPVSSRTRRVRPSCPDVRP